MRECACVHTFASFHFLIVLVLISYLPAQECILPILWCWRNRNPTRARPLSLHTRMLPAFSYTRARTRTRTRARTRTRHARTYNNRRLHTQSHLSEEKKIPTRLLTLPRTLTCTPLTIRNRQFKGAYHWMLFFFSVQKWGRWFESRCKLFAVSCARNHHTGITNHPTT